MKVLNGRNIVAHHFNDFDPQSPGVTGATPTCHSRENGNPEGDPCSGFPLSWE
jgi:hypothetical protein